MVPISKSIWPLILFVYANFYFVAITRFNLSFRFSKTFSRKRSSPPPPNFAPPFCALCLIVCDFLPKTWNLGRKEGKSALSGGAPLPSAPAGQHPRPLRHGLRRATSPKGRGSGETAHFAVQPETIPPCQGLSLWESCHQR